jgi:FKBP-type peptidyl-prolyl cis-trans isomerase SlyD
MIMQISQNTVASIDYTLTDEGGEVIDTSKGRAPVTYLHGAGKLIPGLESALEGQTAGDTLAVKVAPSDAYGERDEGLVQDVPRTAFAGIAKIETGMRFEAQDGSGNSRSITVTSVGDENVTIDANHPLAGKPLTFEVNIVEVREATAEEIENGEVSKD